MRSDNGDGLSKGNKWKTPRTEAQERGGVAQLVERLPCKQEVVSSILIVSTRSCHVGYVGVCAVQFIT